MSKIVVYQNEVFCQEVALDQEHYLIGRAPNNDVVLEQPEVSGFHAKISRDGEHYYIEDQGSRNGTFVDGVPVKRYRLKEGNIIAIGKFTLKCTAGIAATSDSSDSTNKPASGAVPEAKTQVVNLTEISSALEMHKRTAYMRSASQGSGNNARLVSISSNFQAKTYPVRTQAITLGRTASCTVQTGGWPFFSPPLLASVEWRDGAVFITPLAPGRVLCNGRVITQATPLNDGDTLKVGKVELKFFT